MRTYTVLTIGLLFIGVSACQNKSIPIPDEVLDTKSMSAVMADMQLAESALSIVVIDSLDTWREVYFAAIFEKHEITPVLFDSSFHFYQKHPELMGQILDEVLIILSKLQTENPWVTEEETQETLEEKPNQD